MNPARIFTFLRCFILAFSALQIEANEAGWTTNHLAGTGRDPLPYLAEPFLPHLTHSRPVDLEFVPGGDEIVVAEFEGKIWAFSEDSQERRLVAHFEDEPETRIYNIELHPDFPKVGRAWLASNRKLKGVGTNRIHEIKASWENGQLRLFLEERREILSWESTGHDGCDLKYSPLDGCLYISTGDGQVPGDPANTGQTTDNLLGSILRIDVSDPENPSQIPADNPFTNDPTVRDEVWAYGLRNPWRMSFIPGTSDLFVGDNGDENWDSVRQVTKATNHGWSAFEGAVPFRLTNLLGGPIKEMTNPVMDHSHTEIRSVIGGFVYRGKALPELLGHYIYGCYLTGKVWAFEWDGTTATNPRRICDVKGPLVSFAEDRNHELLIVSYNGPILRLVRNPSPPAKRSIPATLSATGLFSETRSMTPDTGVEPYEIAAPAWQDGATVARHVGVSANAEKQINVVAGDREKKSWEFPDGSAFAQTITRDGKRSETRVIHRDGGEWQFFTYRWREDQSDADLVPEEGAVTADGSYRFPARAECAACHTQRSFFVLGLSTEQLNIPVSRNDTEVNQIDWLLEKHPDWFGANRIPGLWRDGRPDALANPYETNSGVLDDRARNYLHVNCAHCHRESGLGGRAQFQLLKSLSLEDMNASNATPLLGLPGVENPKIIAPGDPDRSEIYRRIATEGAGRMPLLDSLKVDEAGAELIREWIDSLLR